jgi:phospholipid/cholesterol/gamma-HCH transport system permease protein
MVERRIATPTTMPSAELALERPSADQLVVRLAGPWRMSGGVPEADEVARALSDAPAPHQIAFQAEQLGAWDSALLIFLERVAALAGEHGVAIDRSGLPNGVQRLLTLSEAVPERQGARGGAERPGFLARVGVAAMAAADGGRAFLDFIGQLTIAAGNALRGRARFRAGDLLLFMQQAGADALPIVTLISFLVGVIMAFVGAIQLEKFGAEIYVADLVGIAVVHEMGALMTGIIMAGRTGAAFAAQLGTMKVTQEIDALTTMGINPMEFLVLPRAVALCVMMPLLCLYANLVGILGGAVIAGGMLSINPEIYFRHVFTAVQVSDLAGGVFKAAVYGVLVAVAGCLRGMQSGSSASAVGDAATSAVVTGIVLIVCACGLLAVVFYVLGI